MSTKSQLCDDQDKFTIKCRYCDDKAYLMGLCDICYDKYYTHAEYYPLQEAIYEEIE